MISRGMARLGRMPHRSDWLVDVRFTGLWKGKTITRRVGVSGWLSRDAALKHALETHLYICDPSRILDLEIRRRDECTETHSQWREKLKSASVAPYTVCPS